MSFKYYKTAPLILTIIILSMLIEYCLTNLISPILSYYQIPTSVSARVPTTESIVGLLLLLYNIHLWKIPIFNYLMTVPDMNGRYIGKVNYYWNGSPGEKKCVIEVIQTASKIKINTYFSNGNNDDTTSCSVVENIIRREDGYYEIVLYYRNNGTKQLNDLDEHEGTNILKFIPGNKKREAQLRGHYFTNRKTQTKGEIEATLISKQIEGKF